MSKHWEPCPKCEGKKVKTNGKLFWFLLFLGSGSVLIWLGFLFPPIWFIAIALIVGSPIGFILPAVNQCQDCKHSWAVKKNKIEAS